MSDSEKGRETMVEAARLDAAIRMLLDSGDMTPMAARILGQLPRTATSSAESK